MKTLFLLSLGCLLAGAVHAAVPPADFAGVPWGASLSEARKGMAQRGTEFVPKGSTEKLLIFTGGKFAGEEAGRWELRFDAGEFCDARVWLKGGGKAEPLYRRLVTMLSGKYGSSSGKQVAHRKAPHFVYGLGWRESGTVKPPMHSNWTTESGISGQTMEISCWVARGGVVVQYQSEKTKALSNLTATKKSRPEDDL